MWQIELLGGLRAVRGDRVITHFRTQKVGALLAYLAFYPERVHSRGELVELLWPECDPEAGRLRLRVTLASLRQVLEPAVPGAGAVPAEGGVLVADRATVRLSRGACLTDAARFEADVQAAGRADVRAERQARRLEAALQRYRGELLPGYFEAWIVPERQRLTELFLQALGALVTRLTALGDLPGALQHARRAVAADPLREETRQDLIRLLAESGQYPAALREYEELEQLLKREWGVAPSPEIRRLIRELKPRGAEAVALLLPVGTAQKPSIPAEPRLPPSFTRFFGREPELDQLGALLRGHGVPEGGRGTEGSHPIASRPEPERLPRLITLTGPAGIGKTRLAVEAAARCRQQPDDVWFVPLADVGAARQIGDALLDALRLPRSPQGAPLEQVIDHLAPRGAGDRPALLLLDNFEHLVEEGARLVRTLLERVPSLTVLVTSRRRLNLEGEREIPLSPLPVPEAASVGQGIDGPASRGVSLPVPEALLDCASVRLYVDRARAIRPEFDVTPANAAAVAGLCRWLEGLPLALELAAAQVGVLTPAQMLARLRVPPEQPGRFDLLVSRTRDASARHGSLRAAIDGSYHLLSPELKRFFAQLAVFRGGFTLEAAEIHHPHALEHLAQLRDASLVIAEAETEDARYRLLETLRAYAAQQGDPAEREAAARRHRDYYLGLAEADGRQQEAAWLDRVQAEHENLRAALAGCLTRRDVDAGLRLTRAMHRFWCTRGYLSEGRQWLREFLALLPVAAPTVERARALDDAGLLAALQREMTAARPLLEESHALFRQLADDHGTALSLDHLANLSDDVSARAPLYEESLAIWRRLDNRDRIANSLFNLSIVAVEQGRYAHAGTLTAECMAIYRSLSSQTGIALAISQQADIAEREGDRLAARSLFEEALSRWQALGDGSRAAEILVHLGRLSRAEGDLIRAQRRFAEALGLARELENREATAVCLKELAETTRLTDDPAEARLLWEEARALFREIGDDDANAACREALAQPAIRSLSPLER